MTLTLTPEQERQLKARAERHEKPIEEVLDEWLTQDTPQKTTAPAPKPKSGAEVLASWKRKGILGKAFMDRPEDSPELARILRANAERRTHE